MKSTWKSLQDLKIVSILEKSTSIESLYMHLNSLLEHWFDKFTRVVMNHGYTQGQSDHTLFIKHSNDGKVVILIVYVDDIIVTGNYINKVRRLKEVLAREFEIKNLGTLKYFLGIEVAHSKRGIVVSQ